MTSRLYGVFANHSPELCPMNNQKSKELFIKMKDSIDANISKYKITRLIGFYMAVLEHEWTLIFEAESAYDVEQLCIDIGLGITSTVRIVLLADYNDIYQKIK